MINETIFYHYSPFLFFSIKNEKQNTKDYRSIRAWQPSILAPLNNTEDCFRLVVVILNLIHPYLVFQSRFVPYNHWNCTTPEKNNFCNLHWSALYFFRTRNTAMNNYMSKLLIYNLKMTKITPCFCMENAVKR